MVMAPGMVLHVKVGNFRHLWLEEETAPSPKLMDGGLNDD